MLLFQYQNRKGVDKPHENSTKKKIRREGVRKKFFNLLLILFITAILPS